MTLNGIIALILCILWNLLALGADYARVVEDRAILFGTEM